MVFVSVTRLRIRSLRFVLPFALDTIRTRAQLGTAEGLLTGSLLSDRKSTFWTMTLWHDRASMRRYMTNGAHLKAMPKLLGWCDEASVVHWDQEDAELPSWQEADRRMRAEGRPSKVRHPTANHDGLAYDPPRTTGSVELKPKRPV